MNRQFRRAQEKQDKKQEKEKERRRAERRSKVQRARSARAGSRSRKDGADDKRARADGKGEPAGKVEAKGNDKPAGPVDRRRLPGRFSGVLTLLTVFFITLQGAVPVEEQEGVGQSLISAGFYLMLGYFATLWFMRRGVNRAPLMAVIGGVLLGVSVTVSTLIQGGTLDPLLLALILPGLVIGVLLGRLVFTATPR